MYNSFNPFPYFTSFSSFSSGGICEISINSPESSSVGDDVPNKSLSSAFCLLNFTLSAIFSSGYDLLFSSFFD